MTPGTRGPFERFTNDDVAALIAGYPLAWVCPVGGDPASAALLPLIGEYDSGGTLTSLIGHYPKSFPLAGRFRQDPSAMILFSGPNGYVSREHAGRRNWGPTWNFAQLRIAATIAPDDELTDESLDVLTDAMERHRAEPWDKSELRERYPSMAVRIIGFRASVTHLDGRFKLGQDETPETLRSILACHPDPTLVRWMQRCNPDRC